MSASSNNEYYSTLELVINDQDANAPELVQANTSRKVAVKVRPELFLNTSAPEVVAPEKEVYISPSPPGKDRKGKSRILALIVLLLVVLGVAIGTGIGIRMTKQKSSNPKFTSMAVASSRIAPSSSTPTTVSSAKLTSDTTISSRDSNTKSLSSPSFSSTLSTKTAASSSLVRPVTITLSPSTTASSVSPTTCTWLGHCLGAPCATFNDCSGTMICSKDNKCAPIGSQ